LSFLREIWNTLGGSSAALRRVEIDGGGVAPPVCETPD
jgi:hypothetical protein